MWISLTGVGIIDKPQSIGMTTPPLLAAVPQLPALDLAATRRFYVDTLGFRLHAEYPGFMIVTYGHVDLHFFACTSPHLPHATSLYLRVPDLDRWFALCQGHLHPDNSTIVDQPWGQREFYALDPSGICLKFGGPLH